ncbi:MAG: presqualene diphosphate synthase HpnD [Marinicaulis sp.]|nr:presqualene diphosphate synthase HpnD [Marinicaulis sp.]NNL87759.1 presqualene diphosphate synthase HpnD [Marinicaulis sp.]
MTTASPAISTNAAKRHAESVVRESGTSFGAGMRILSKPRREAMYAVYAFCREVDDIADGELPGPDKKHALQQWRLEVERIFRGAPQTPTGVALIDPVNEFNLPKSEFFLVIEGMEMDAMGPIVAPTKDGLFAYTRRAAGAVGMLSMPIFGAAQGAREQEFALSLGDALQLTNILRDVEEDAAIGRLYLPYELLKKHGCPLTPDAIATAEGLPAVRGELAGIARQKFADARAALANLDWKTLRPALLMMGVYERYLDKMEKRGWVNGQAPVKISKLEKSAIALRWFFAPKRA